MKPIRVLIMFISLLTLSSVGATDIQKTLKFVGESESIGNILVQNGFNKNSAFTLLRSPVLPARWHLNPKDKFLVLHNAQEGTTELRFYSIYDDSALVFSQTPGGANVEKKDINFKTIVRAAEGFIRGSLNEAIKSFFNNEWVVSRFEDAYIWDHDLNKKISREDKFKIILEEKYDHGLLVKYGEVLRAELTLQGQTIQRVSLSSQGERVFIDPDKSFRDRLFFAPVDFLHISSPFSKRRFHPVRRNIQPHLGMDFALPEGSPVYAPRDGTITDAAKKRGSGNFIVIDHQDGYSSIYNHLKGFAHGVQIGQKVKAGEVIAFVGCTGYCTSPHLHFSIRKGKTMLNPAPLTKPYPFRLKDYERSEEYRNILVGLDQRT